jgi:chemotaxis protein methyltransferase CheR
VSHDEDTQPVVATGEVKPLDDGEFALFQRIVLREAGIHLGDVKRALVAARLLRRVRELGLRSYGAYYRRAAEDHDELRRMLDAITTNETQFFREPRHFELLSQSIIPAWKQAAARGERSRRVRLWSAGCSTGEEPYSLAMALSSELPEEEGWQIEVLATDLSTRVLDHARQGIYTAEKAAAIPRHLLQRFMLKGYASQDGKVCASPALQAMITFKRLNLNDASWVLPGPFDAIFCRNVFIYFGRATRERIVEAQLQHLVPRGLFFVGHAESLGGTAGLETVIPTVYRKAQDAAVTSSPAPGPRRSSKEAA